jgi:hypothetical protein
MRLVADESDPDRPWLYIAQTRDHCVLRAQLPALAGLDTTVPATLPAQVVLGRPGHAGFVDTSLPGVSYPEIQDVSAPLPQAQALLDAPSGLDFDAAGNLLVATATRVRLLEKAGLGGAGGRVYTLAGGLDTRYLEGDSRLAYFPGTSQLAFDAVHGDVLLADSRLHLVRRLWTRRGAL